MRDRKRSLVIKVDDTELAKLHALAADGDEHVARMLRRWLGERYVARFGDAPPPASRTKFGDAVKPSVGGDR